MITTKIIHVKLKCCKCKPTDNVERRVKFNNNVIEYHYKFENNVLNKLYAKFVLKRKKIS